MNEIVVVTFLLLVPAFLLANSQIAWEMHSIRSIVLIGDRSQTRIKLVELGRTTDTDYENFRYKQLILSVIASFILIALWILNFLSGSVAIFFTVIAIASILFVTERNLISETRRHRVEIEREFPPIVEMLTLALSAGLTPLSALSRIAMRGTGHLPQEISSLVQEVSLGQSLADSLDKLGRRINSVPIRRFADSVVIAVVRGAPLIQILHSHVREARDFERSQVLNAAAKAEVSMMVPVVFLILPVSILFALWPSLSNLNFFAEI